MAGLLFLTWEKGAQFITAMAKDTCQQIEYAMLFVAV